MINAGKMAVVLEIEVSEPFGCRGWETSTCDQAQVDRELDEMYRLGVRSSLLLNKFDNPLTGVRFDSGPIGVLINGANKQSAGSFWSAKTCTGPLPTTRSRRSSRRAARSWTARSGRWASRAARSPPIRRRRTATRAG